jgi:hypothetical protein
MDEWMRPQRLERLVSQLAARAERVLTDKNLPNPRITLHLQSGRDLQGSLLALSNDGAASSLTLLRDTDSRFGQTVTHVPLQHIEAITIHDAHLLEAPTNQQPVPSKLELRRRAKEWQERLQLEIQSAWADADLEPLAALLELLGPLFQDLLSEPMGREALQQKVHQVRLEVQGEPSIKLEAMTLVIATTRALSTRLNTAALRSSIEQWL